METMPQLFELLRSQELAHVVGVATKVLLAHAARSGALVTPKGVVALRTALPKEYLPHTAVIIDLCVGNQKAERLGKAQGGWLFTSVGAEQSTHPLIAAYHAEMFKGCRRVVEVCTGSGADAQAIAAVVDHVTTFESDAITAALAQGNFLRAGIQNVEVVHAAVPCDAWELAMQQADGLWADPSRRTPSGKRTRSIAHHDPPLALLVTHPVVSLMRAVGVKLGPADDVPPELTRGLCREYIGYGAECKELLLRTRTTVEVTATIVKGIGGLEQIHNQESRIQSDNVRIQNEEHNVSHALVSHEVLLEPHATLIASGLLSSFYKEHGITPIDPRIAYGLIAEDPGPSEWWTRFRVLAVDEGVSEKRMQIRIREFGWNKHTEFKKRGWPRDPEELRRALTFTESDHHGVVLIVRVGDGHRTYYAERLV